MIEVKYVPPVEEIVIGYDDTRFRELAESCIVNDEYCSLEDYSCIDDFAQDVTIYINESNRLCTIPFLTEPIGLFEVDSYTSRYFDEIASQIYGICEDIIKDIVRSGTKNE